MSSRIHPRQALFEGERPFPIIPSCEHFAGSEKLISKALELQQKMHGIFDATMEDADGDDGAAEPIEVATAVVNDDAVSLHIEVSTVAWTVYEGTWYSTETVHSAPAFPAAPPSAPPGSSDTDTNAGGWSPPPRTRELGFHVIRTATCIGTGLGLMWISIGEPAGYFRLAELGLGAVFVCLGVVEDRLTVDAVERVAGVVSAPLRGILSALSPSRRNTQRVASDTEKQEA